MSFSHIPNTGSPSYCPTLPNSSLNANSSTESHPLQPNSYNPKPHPLITPSKASASNPKPHSQSFIPATLFGVLSIRAPKCLSPPYTPPGPPPAPHRVAEASLLWPLSPRPPASCGRSSCSAPPPPCLRRSTCSPWRRRERGPGPGSLTHCDSDGRSSVYCWAAVLSVSSLSARRNRISGVYDTSGNAPQPLLLKLL